MSSPSAVNADAAKVLSLQHVVRIGDTAPDFTADSQLGPIHLYEYLGNGWGMLFSHPQDFTPVCTTELGRVAHLNATGEFSRRNCKVLALGVDTVESHKEWIEGRELTEYKGMTHSMTSHTAACTPHEKQNHTSPLRTPQSPEDVEAQSLSPTSFCSSLFRVDINEINQCRVDFPILADYDRRISVLYGMLDQTHLHMNSGMPFTVRSVFIIDPQHIVRLIVSYPAPTGRNFEELLRVLDSLQLAVSHKVATPADWKRGKETVVLASVDTAEAERIFPKGITVIRPWLRMTPDPSAQ